MKCTSCVSSREGREGIEAAVFAVEVEERVQRFRTLAFAFRSVGSSQIGMRELRGGGDVRLKLFFLFPKIMKGETKTRD
jgi:hypothetical protein